MGKIFNIYNRMMTYLTWPQFQDRLKTQGRDLPMHEARRQYFIYQHEYQIVKSYENIGGSKASNNYVDDYVDDGYVE